MIAACARQERHSNKKKVMLNDLNTKFTEDTQLDKRDKGQTIR